jgi:ABC-2 type transport system ATP-binding protein
VISMALETWSLSKEIRGRQILEEVSLKVPRGSVFALLGPEGAGKSTLLKIILGVQTPTSGGGLCLDLDILTRGVQIRERVGFIGQAPRYYSYMRVSRLLDFCSGFYPCWDGALAERLLQRFSLPPQMNVRELTPVMKSQIGLVLALAPRPELLLLDHSTADFDPVERRLFFSIALEEVVSPGGTLFIASPRLDEVAWVADRAALLNEGRLIYEGPMEALRHPEREIRVVFEEEIPPGLFHRPGIRMVRREESAHLIAVSDNLEEIWQACAAQPHEALELVDPGLAEVVARFAKGGRKDAAVVPIR